MEEEAEVHGGGGRTRIEEVPAVWFKKHLLGVDRRLLHEACEHLMRGDELDHASEGVVLRGGKSRGRGRDRRGGARGVDRRGGASARGGDRQLRLLPGTSMMETRRLALSGMLHGLDNTGTSAGSRVGVPVVHTKAHQALSTVEAVEGSTTREHDMDQATSAVPAAQAPAGSCLTTMTEDRRGEGAAEGGLRVGVVGLGLSASDSTAKDSTNEPNEPNEPRSSSSADLYLSDPGTGIDSGSGSGSGSIKPSVFVSPSQMPKQ